MFLSFSKSLSKNSKNLEKNLNIPIFSGKVQLFLETFGALSISRQLLNQVFAVIVVG